MNFLVVARRGLLAALVICPLHFLQAEEPQVAPSGSAAKTDAPRANEQAFYKQFEETLSGARMTGRFTITGKEGDLKEESYVIKKVTRLEIDDLWRFDVHMKYGDVDKAFALAVPVKWAGDTAVISLDKTTIPGLGSFSARVVIDGRQYAGTWMHHGAAGGHLFGVIEKAKDGE